MKDIYPKIPMTKNRNNFDKNNINKIENKNNKLQKNNIINDIKSKTLNMNNKIKKEKLFKTNRKISADKINKKDFKIYSNQKYTNHSLRNYINKNNIINDNIELDENKNVASHNIIIRNLLMRTENFFNELGLHLDQDNSEKKSSKKAKKNRNDFIEFLQRNNIGDLFEKDSKKFNKLNIKEENKKIKKNSTIFDNYSGVNNNLNSKNISSRNNKSYNNIKDNKINNESKTIKHNIKVYYKKNKNKKMVSDEIIQTFNILDNYEQKEKENEKEIKKVKEKGKVAFFPIKNKILPILPRLSPSSSLGKLEFDKNQIKIAEIKPVFPLYPYNRIDNSAPLNNNKFNHNIHKKLILDMKISHDDRYNYEQLMNKIKLETKNKRENFKSNYCYNYRYGQNSSDKNNLTNRKLY